MSQSKAPLKKIGELTNLSCARKYDYYLVDIFKNKVKACCKTNFYSDTKSINEDLLRIQKDRLELKRGIRIGGCETCWELESAGHSSFRTETSYRDQQNMELHLHRPFVLEFWIGTLCNLRCVYCSADSSSKWATKQSTTAHTSKFEISDEVKSFTEQTWYTTDRYNIAGGEPSLIPATLKIFSMIQDLAIRCPTPKKKTIFVVSNLSTPVKTFDAFLDKMELLTDFVDVDVAISAENIGEQFEFVRDGTDFQVFQKNLENLISRDQLHFSLLSSHSILSIKNYHLFLAFLFEHIIKRQRKLNLIYNEVVFPRPLSPRLYPTRLDEERKLTAQLLEALPQACIPYQKFFHLFCSEIDQLYDSLGKNDALDEARLFLDAAAPSRLSKMNWRTVFPDLA